MQYSLINFECENCGRRYNELGHWRDGQFCPLCSANLKQHEEDRKKELRKKAAEIRDKFGLDFDQYPSDLPEDVKQELNPKGAGRKMSKYCDEYCELIVEDASEGKSEAEFAARVKVTQAALLKWTETHPRFKAARERANELRNAWIERL